MTTSSKVLLVNLAIFVVCAVYGKSGDIGTMMVLIFVQFVANLIMGFAAREGKSAYFLSAFLVPIIGFAVCLYDF